MERIKIFEIPLGATPLDPGEIAGLIPRHITTQQQLNEWEQANILDAEKWAARQEFQVSKIMTMEFIRKLHKKMFGKTWAWAGQFRQSNKNIGVDWPSVSVSLKLLLDDVFYQIENNIYSRDELATRFHHRLVFIHLFPNGNGRHARLMTDILLLSQGAKRFSWGRAKTLVNISPTREKYIQALRCADQKDYGLLLEFVRS